MPGPQSQETNDQSDLKNSESHATSRELENVTSNESNAAIVGTNLPNNNSDNTSDNTKAGSPTSSIASQKPPLEWDSGADVGYASTSFQEQRNQQSLIISTIERMALARGHSAALRLDPEGTTQFKKSAVTNGSSSTCNTVKPHATSTPNVGNFSESESDIEITPIVKSLTIVAEVINKQERETASKNSSGIIIKVS